MMNCPSILLLSRVVPCLLLLACGGSSATSESVYILIMGGTIITMDSSRRVLEDGAIAIVADRIVAVGKTAELVARYKAAEVIDARRKIIMPGLIDGHGHAGHGLVKSLGMDINAFYPAIQFLRRFTRVVLRWTSGERLRAFRLPHFARHEFRPPWSPAK